MAAPTMFHAATATISGGNRQLLRVLHTDRLAPGKMLREFLVQFEPRSSGVLCRGARKNGAYELPALSLFLLTSSSLLQNRHHSPGQVVPLVAEYSRVRA